MHLICIRKNVSNYSNESFLRFALLNEPIGGVVLDELSRCLYPDDILSCAPERLERLDLGKTIYAIPEEWRTDSPPLRDPRQERRGHYHDVRLEIVYYGENVLVPFVGETMAREGGVEKPWFVLSNGRFAAKIDIELLKRILHSVEASVVAVQADPNLLGEREEVRLTTEGKVAAFHRMYEDSAEFAFTSTDWPHYLFIRTSVLDRVLPGGSLPLSFSVFSQKCRSEGLTLRTINVGGAVLDLESEAGLLSFCGTRLSKSRSFERKAKESKILSGHPKRVGEVLLGSDVSIASDVIIVGPTIIGDRVHIESGAIVSSSVIGPDVCVPKNEIVRDCIVKGPRYERRSPAPYRSRHLQQISNLSHEFNLSQDSCRSFRKWGRFSYARCLKRVTDALVAIVVLLLFAPLIPFVALAIKLTSPGPVFYKDRRQGLHGKDFNCLKFRTMITGAHAIQEKLRVVSQVDGPQFKMEDDPRISTVGRFLRETYIDEIPQFFNVLSGQMSVVGPRPSPEAENTLCPLWRDARLSVRPGITGLWQVHRTRQPMRDFQEWIHYDIEYVRNLSLRMDLSICWQTTRKLLDNFISQF
jgi:lipopolysaccharide/colanic/teichoic acid biosynthesis glycosyltransferase